MLQDPFELLHANVDEVIAEWRALVECEPWAPAPARLMNSLPTILPRLFGLARSGSAQVDLEFSELIAHEHGFSRREDRVPLAALAEEWNHLKRACGLVLRRQISDASVTNNAVRRLDLLIDDAIGYSLRGYYRPELDELRGRGLERRTDTGDRRAGDGDRRGADQ